MAKRNTGRRGSRKRRPAPQPRPEASEAVGCRPASAKAERPRRERGAAAPSSGGYRDPGSVGERPQAPWHPLPLSELLILVGAIGTIVGIRTGDLPRRPGSDRRRSRPS